MRSLVQFSAGRYLLSPQNTPSCIIDLLSCCRSIGLCAATGLQGTMVVNDGPWSNGCQADVQQQQQLQQPDLPCLRQLAQQDDPCKRRLQPYIHIHSSRLQLPLQQKQQGTSWLCAPDSSRAYSSRSNSISRLGNLTTPPFLLWPTQQQQQQQQPTTVGQLLVQQDVAAHQQQAWCQQQQRGIKQLTPHALAPKPLPRFRKPSKDGRMNRMVIRIPPQVKVELQDDALKLTGKAGCTSLKLPFLDPTGLVAWQAHIQSAADTAAGPGTGSLLLLASPSKRCWRGIQTHINNAVHGVMQGYLIGLTVQGVGYRMEPVPEKGIAAALAAKRGAAAEDATAAAVAGSKRRIIWEQEAEKTNIAYPHKEPAKAVRLKVGYTRACIFQLPEGVMAFFVKPTLMYLYGIDKALVTNTAAAIRAVRKPNAYTGNGIQLVGEVLKLKQRAGSK